MALFIIQVDELGVPVTEDGWQVIQVIKFQNWRFRDNPTFVDKIMLSATPVKDAPHGCPVGTVEFVHEHMRLAGMEPPRPLNVPPGAEHLGMRRFYPDARSLQRAYKTHPNQAVFVKSALEVKSMDGMCAEWPVVVKMMKASSPGSFQVSDYINNLTGDEWRVFVKKSTYLDILDKRRYSGDSDIMPDACVVKSFVDALVHIVPSNFSFDIALTTDGAWVLIEVHHAYSTGLYGMDSKLLSQWLWSWWKWYTDNQKSSL